VKVVLITLSFVIVSVWVHMSLIFCFFFKMLVALVVGCLPMWLIWKILNGHSVVRVTTMFVASLFIISFSVTYCRMYKVRCAWWDFFFSVLQIYSVINQTQATCKRCFGCKYQSHTMTPLVNVFVATILELKLVATKMFTSSLLCETDNW